jgi:hypothetical protein
MHVYSVKCLKFTVDTATGAPGRRRDLPWRHDIWLDAPVVRGSRVRGVECMVCGSLTNIKEDLGFRV